MQFFRQPSKCRLKLTFSKDLNVQTLLNKIFTNMTIDNCKIIDLPKIQDPRGNLTYIEGGQHIPFDIQRVYYLYDVPGGAERGGHAHKGLHQLIIAMSGSFDVLLDDGKDKKRVHLNRSYNGLYVCPMIWRELDNFSSGSVCMVIASNRYDEEDYYREYGAFMRSRWGH